jgi:hypothetical protein
MSAVWAKVLAALASLVKPLLAYLIYRAGGKAKETEIQAEQAKADAELARDYLDNRDGRTPSDTLGRMQDGSF